MYGYEPYEQEMFSNIFAGLGIFLGFIILLGIISTVLITVGMWKSLKKAGKGGWESLVPYYNMVVLCQISGLNPWWVLIIAVGPIVLSFIPVLGGLASFALAIYFQVIFNISIAKSFGKETGFAFGLMFLPFVFWPMLGGKNSNYVGTKVFDPLFSSILKENNIVTVNQNMNNNMNTGMPDNSFNNNMNTGMPDNSFNNNMNIGTPNNSFNNNMNTGMPDNSFNNNMNTGMPDDSFNNNMNINSNDASSFKYCKNCGSKLAIDATFCGHCGSKQN